MTPFTSDENSSAGKYYAAGIWRTSAYPIAVCVQAIMTERGLTRGQVAAALGYRNGVKTLRHLDCLVEGQAVPPEFLKRFTSALDINGEQLHAALEATRAVQQEEARLRREAEIAAARAAFRPHLRVVSERKIPQPIFVAAFTGSARWLKETVPEEVLTLPLAPQMCVLGELVRAHYSRMNGSAGPFGAIEGYLFRTEFETAIRLDTDGMVQGEHAAAVPEGRAFLKL